MTQQGDVSYKALKQAYGFFIGFSVLLLAIILWANNGVLTFVLDDPFIHLAMAENIMLGHYGVNLSEPSSPASSILWPFILAPFTLLPFAKYALLLLNVFFALATIHHIFDFIKYTQSSYGQAYRYSHKQVQGLLILLIFIANLFCLTFIAMEHTLQILLSVVIAKGLLQLHEGETPKGLFYAAIFLAPLIRYESLAISVPAITYIFLCGDPKRSFILSFSVGISLIGFSGFLWWQKLPYLPTSVLLKSGMDVSLFESLLTRLEANLSTPKAWLMLALLVMFIKTGLKKRLPTNTKRLILVSAMAVVLFLLFGRFGWYFRYEIFIWLFLWLIMLFIYHKNIHEKLNTVKTKKRVVVVIAFGVFMTVGHSFYTLLIPLATRNIYMQQYQMSRFVDDFYQKPVAVNDLGLVAYENPYYVLDLWGLASFEAMNKRKQQLDNADWMDELALKYNVGLAMIYIADEPWFSKVPKNWIRLGKLHMDTFVISVPRREVIFFATSDKAKQELIPLLSQFGDSLPDKVSFIFSDKIANE